MANIFDNKTVPINYNKILNKYTSQGYRVLAIGHRVLTE
jgi:magnesium-transporting ATPase (P-type)